MSAPDFVEPIVGYRAWRAAEGGRLVPWSAGRAGAGAWTPGVNQAVCLHRGMHPGKAPPVADCSCGLYALARHDDARLRPAREAVGAIVAWGDVEVHATGFRAQYAAVVAIGIPEDADPAHLRELRAAAARYGVAAVAVDHLPDTALEYGRPVAFEAIVAPRRRSAITIRRTPPPALGAEGARGIALDEHLVVTIERGGIRLEPSPPLAEAIRAHAAAPEPGRGLTAPASDCAADPGGRPSGDTPEEGHPASDWAAEPGTVLAAGDVFARVAGFALRSPVGGVVGEAGAAPWIAPGDWEEDALAVAWGAKGRRLYAAELAEGVRRGDPFAHLRTHWLHAHARIRSARDVLDALRAQRARPRFASGDELVARLDAALAHPDAARAAGRLEGRVRWRLHEPEVDVVLGGGGADAVTLYASAETADDYFAGRLDLPAALRRREVQSAAPLAAILRAASVLKPLHARYAEASSRASSFAS